MYLFPIRRAETLTSCHRISSRILRLLTGLFNSALYISFIGLLNRFQRYIVLRGTPQTYFNFSAIRLLFALLYISKSKNF